MESKFTHYLITRFNVKIDGYGPEYFPPDVRTPEWEEERIPLFENFCAPSVTGQSWHHFIWIIYCDSNTQPKTMERIIKAVADVGRCELIMVRDFQDMISHLRQLCSESGKPFVITSRLDNDDAIGLNFIKDVQTHFIPSGNVVVNLLGGVNYHATRGILTYHRYSLNNSFLSLIEETRPMPEMITVMGFRHLVPKKEMMIRNIPSPYAFWMTLHEKNAAMRANLGWPVFPSSIMKHYAISPSDIEISLLNTLRYVMQWLPGALARKTSYLMKHTFKNKIKRF